MVLAVLVTASAPANNVYSYAVADAAAVATDLTPVPANVPLSGELVMAASIPVTAPDMPAPDVAAAKADAADVDTSPIDALRLGTSHVDASPVDTPNTDAPAVKGPVLAALEAPDEKQLLPGQPMPRNNRAAPQTEEVYDAANAIEILDECLVIDTCANRYLWQLYQKTPKEDSIRESTQHKVTVKKKGKLITVTRTSTVVIDEDFGWKDPKAARNAGMSLADYVIGGVDRDFRLRLFSMLHAADQAGLAPGITSGFRDDYRQSIASGLKAASNRSYHGGSLRGGYGHGLAADIVSVKGATRAERLANSNVLWKWVDTHGIEFGLGRPYLDRDPPHVGPIDGEEFARHRPGAKTRQAAAQAN